jgi:hypothetical protein
MVYHGLSWFIMVLSWLIKVYHGLIMVYHGLSWFFPHEHGLTLHQNLPYFEASTTGDCLSTDLAHRKDAIADDLTQKHQPFRGA